MIQSLIAALHALAAPAEPTAGGDRLIADFDDAYRLACDCRQLEWSSAQRDALDAVERQLARMSDEATRARAEWEHVRTLARRALDVLGERALPAERGRTL